MNKNKWENFTEENLPPHREPVWIVYKELLWKGERLNDDVLGVSPSGEIKLQTTVQRILEHDKDNGDQTKWKR